MRGCGIIHWYLQWHFTGKETWIVYDEDPVTGIDSATRYHGVCVLRLCNFG
jgi:hypothetical protein